MAVTPPPATEIVADEAYGEADPFKVRLTWERWLIILLFIFNIAMFASGAAKL